jgi:hypothetical protein
MSETNIATPATSAAPEPAPQLPAIPRPQVAAGAKALALVPTNLDEVMRIARMAVASGLLKTDKDSGGDPRQCEAMAGMIIMKGLDLGMSPSVALDSIALINGRTAVWGKAVAALIRRAGHKIREWETGTRMADDWTFHCEITRGDSGEVVTRSFSVLDAKQAGLWDQSPKKVGKRRDGSTWESLNTSPWYRYPQRMLPARAKGYAAADGAPEALLGMYLAEEMQDIQRVEEESRGSLVEVAAAPPPPIAAEVEPDHAVPATVPAGEVADGMDSEMSSGHPGSEGEQAPDMEAALLAFAKALQAAKAVEQANDLLDEFNTAFDGWVDSEIGIRADELHESAVKRLRKK